MLIILVHIITFSVFSSENDSLTNRYISRVNSRDFINSHINLNLDKVVEIANSSNNNCDIRKTLKIANKVLVAGVNGAFIFSPTQRMIDNSYEEFGMNRVEMKNSIYKYVKKRNAPILKLFSLSPTMKIDDYIVGSDKFSHFFNLGWEYYSKLKKGKSLEEVLRYSRNLEKNFWGGPTTGVISYSDLMANFQGLRFFGHLSGQGSDPFTGESNRELSYLRCRSKKWIKIRDFEINDYFGPSVDEGANCNVFHSKKIERAVQRSIFELEEDGLNYTCPVIDSICNNLREDYGRLSQYLISPTCH